MRNWPIFYLKDWWFSAGYSHETISQHFLNDFSIIGSLEKSVGIIIWCE